MNREIVLPPIYHQPLDDKEDYLSSLSLEEKVVHYEKVIKDGEDSVSLLIQENKNLEKREKSST